MHSKKEYPLNILKGIVIGIANSIPGVSGGTMMVVMKVFDRLMDIIGDISFKKIKDNFFFLLTLALGMGIGIIASATLLDYCFEHFYVQTQFFFMGVIAGSLPMVYREATANGRFKPVHILPFLCGLALIIVVTVLSFGSHSGSIITSLDPGSFFYLMLVSVAAAAAMIMPGLSGSLVMLILGGYQTVIEAVSLDNILTRFPVLIPVAIGIVIGILGCAKLIKIALEKTRLGTYALILGLIVGSFYAIWPRETIEDGVVTGGKFTLDMGGFIAVIFLLIGVALPLAFDIIGKKTSKE